MAHTRHIRWLLCMTVTLLCIGLCSVDKATANETTAMPFKATSLLSEANGAELCSKQDNIPFPTHDAEQWGAPLSSVIIRGAACRTLSTGEMQVRASRMCDTLCHGGTNSNHEQAKVMQRVLSAKRFCLGYYIYYRCQMRC